MEKITKIACHKSSINCILFFFNPNNLPPSAATMPSTYYFPDITRKRAADLAADACIDKVYKVKLSDGIDTYDFKLKCLDTAVRLLFAEIFENDEETARYNFHAIVQRAATGTTYRITVRNVEDDFPGAGMQIVITH